MVASDQNWRREEFGPYTLLECLGIGGMATVHRAVHHETQNEVAIKRLLPQLARDQALIRQFVREAEIVQALAHPNIVEVVDYGHVDGVHYLAMERIEGQSILALLRRASQDGQPAPIGVSMWILHEILTALEHAMTGLGKDGRPLHIVHRDLSPSNVIVTEAGRVKIIDFGVAKGLDGRYATYSGRIKGKLGYMSPEVLTGRQVDSRSDLYSASVVGWELLTAQRLFRGSEGEQLALRASNRERTPPSQYNRWVPKELDALLAKALAEDPDRRWSSHSEMLAALMPLMNMQGQGASTSALVKWIDQLAVGDGVLDSSKTMHSGRPPRARSMPMPVTMPSAPLNIPGVRRFADDVATVIDPVFDAGKRHQELKQSAIAAGSVETSLPPIAETRDPDTIEQNVDDDLEALLLHET